MKKEEKHNDKPNIVQNEEIMNEEADRGNIEKLKYNEEEDSFELDIEEESTDYPDEAPEYQHEDPYDSVAPRGKDSYSDWDEANPLVGDEYDEDKSLETDLDDLGMHVDSGRAAGLSKTDEKLAETPEDDRGDLDEEGYPRKD